MLNSVDPQRSMEKCVAGTECIAFAMKQFFFFPVRICRRFKFTSDKDLKRKLSEFALHLGFLLLFANRIFFAFFGGGVKMGIKFVEN